MKRLCAAFLCIFFVLTMTLSVFAASSVPKSVIDSTKSVVRVLAEYPDGYATGSGFIIKSNSSETLIVTNYHVVEDNPYSISVWISDDETISASISAYTDQKDMCILKLAYPVSLKPLAFAQNGAKQGEAVYAVGFPGAADYLSDREAHTSAEATITDGIVSAVRETTVSAHGTPVKILQINAAINAGNSGGPLFNADGEVTGINTLGINDSQGIFGAIDVSELENFIADHGIAIPRATNAFPWLIVGIAAAVIALSIVAIFIVKRKKKMKSPAQTTVQKISLAEYIALHPNGIGIYNATAMLLPVAISLRDLHNNGAAHLEVSPNSIVVDTNGAVLNSATAIESNRYTSGYAAPEIYKGLSAGNLSDIYSFCAVLFFVATGQQPANALSRTGAEYEYNEEMQIDASFLEIIKTGTALDATNRIPSIQEIIIKLSAYNTHPFVNDVLPNEQPTSEEKPKKKRRNPIVIVLISVAILIIALLGIYFGCYIVAKNNARNKDFSAAEKLLLLPFVTELHDPDLAAYIEAGRLMESREYARAAEAFDDLGNYEDASNLTNESNYRLALQYADKNIFHASVILLNKLGEVNYSNAKEKTQEIQYRWVWSLIDEGKYNEAYDKLKILGNYPGAKETLNDLTELMYLEAQTFYAKNSYVEAEKLLNRIKSYKDSSKYITLIKAHDQPTYFNTESNVNSLIEIFYFEDAAELLLSNQLYAEQFLLGKWCGDGYYFTMKESGNISYDLPWFDYGDYYRIENGKILLYPENDESKTKTLYEFTAISPDCIVVLCHKNGKTYTLYRQ